AARCAGHENWHASGHLSGGTPGRANAPWEVVQDLEGPGLVSVFVEDPKHLRLTFDEALDTILMADVDRYLFIPALFVTSLDVEDQRNIVIRLRDSIQSGELYTLTAFPAFDCLGNPATNVDSPRTFGLPAIP